MKRSGGVREAWVEAGIINADGQPLVSSEVLMYVTDLQNYVGDLEIRLGESDEARQVLKDLLEQRELKIRRILRDEDARLKNHPRYEEAVEVLTFWQQHVHPGAREIEGQGRLKNVLARLDGGYSVEQLKRAALGYKAKPYMVRGRRTAQGSKEDWKADAELIYREPGFVDQGLRIVEQEEMYEQALKSSPLAQGAALNGNGSVPAPTVVSPQTPADKAVWYAAGMGCLVFPCRPGDKVPATTHGLNDATKDAERIRRYWTRNPSANIAVRTGQESNLVVLDVDGDEGFEALRDLEKANSKLPRTLSVVTPRGGSHYYFQHPGREIRNSASQLGPGLDVRGDGGYVLVPPSTVRGRSYEFDERTKPATMPTWLLKLLLTVQARSAQGGMDYVAFVREGTTEGARDTQLTRLVGHLYSKGFEPAEVYELTKSVNDARCKPPLPAGQVRKIVESIDRRRQRAALRELEGAA